MNTINMDSMSLTLLRLTLFLHLVGHCFDLGLGRNINPAGKFGPAFLFLSFRTLI